MHCAMGCQPPKGGGEEKFYRIVMEELTIYGHTTDAYTKEHYPTEMADTLAGRAEGIEFGCWHSSWCPDGEIGRQDLRPCKPITYEQFMEAAEADWPFVQDEGITQEGPVAGVAVVEPDGTIVPVWDSLHGDLT